jgi:hypothetical protein
MVPENRRYIIFDASEAGLINFNEVLQTSVETLRLSVDETKALIKYDPSPAQEEVLYEEGDPDISEEVLYEEGDPTLDEDDPRYDPDVSVGDVRVIERKVGDVKIVGRTGDEVPPSVESLTTKSKGYTHAEILEVLSTEEWTQKMNEGEVP